MYGDSRENLFEILAVAIIWSPISSVCGITLDGRLCICHSHTLGGRLYRSLVHSGNCVFLCIHHSRRATVYRCVSITGHLHLSLSIGDCVSLCIYHSRRETVYLCVSITRHLHLYSKGADCVSVCIYVSLCICHSPSVSRVIDTQRYTVAVYRYTQVWGGYD